MTEERPPVASEVDHRVPVDGGEIVARVYRPDSDGPLPCYLYLHGGGFWLGTLEQGESACRGIATDAECVVVNLDYRLAPEHKFPTAPEDCYAALRWIVENAAALGLDPSRIAVGGGSAGGNLAAVVALMARDRGGPPLVLQVLEIAVLDFTGKEDSRSVYLRDAEDATNPYASPMLATDLMGLPPALVMSAEFDPLERGGRSVRRTPPRGGRRGRRASLGGAVPRLDAAREVDPRRGRGVSRAGRGGVAARLRHCLTRSTRRYTPALPDRAHVSRDAHARLNRQVLRMRRGKPSAKPKLSTGRRSRRGSPRPRRARRRGGRTPRRRARAPP